MKRKQILLGCTVSLGMFMLILDSKTALAGAQDGILLCMQTVIPALFPFFLLSGLIIQTLPGLNLRIFHWVERIFYIPRGSGAIFAIGLLSGYPVGAQLIAQAYQDHQLLEKTAKRMLGFCSNAGPAFLFGMVGPMFSVWYIPWVLWSIHILGACVAGWFLHRDTAEENTELPTTNVTLVSALQKAVKNMALVCGWVVIFRVFLAFCQRWFLWLFSNEIQVIFYGIWELSNGCMQLQNISSDAVRFLVAGLFLSFGGICVMLQTASVTGILGMGMYWKGKAIQSLVTAILCLFLSPALFPGQDHPVAYIGLAVLLMMGFAAICLIRKKVVAIPGKMLYNTGNSRTKGAVLCCFERKSTAPAAIVKEVLP